MPGGVADGDRTLLRRALDGDHAAMTRLYVDYRRRVAGFVRRIDRRLSEADVEDVVHATFLAMLPRRRMRPRSYDGHCTAMTYLCAVARRAYLAQRRCRTRALPLEPAGASLRDAAAGPAQQVEHRDTLRRVAEAATQLSALQRQALLNALDPDAKSARSDVARRRLCDARQKLRRIVEGGSRSPLGAH